MGGSTGGIPGTGDSQIGNTGGTTGITGAVVPPPPPPPIQRGSLDSLGGGGRTYFQQRPDVASAFNQNSQGLSPTQFSQQHFQQFGQFEGNVSDPSKQFYQPVFQPQYQNYNMGNPMSISQYGQGFGGFNPYMPQMQTPFNPYTNSFGYGGYGMQSPFSFQPQFQPQMGMGMQTPFSSGMSQPAPQRVSSGPAQAIVSRSAGLRGTPNVMRRAEGGITSLMDAE